ncbi:Rhodanese-related sulfurtransferase [hydrothermal vent metagenome]|uniref:Rhodanese-related sulfurtransferase n=1 Tax=hydrothermal vent metagenome TaxID=652676 RepID=A0A1W1DSI3_9ZZZZ
MTINNAVSAMAGVIVMISLLLGSEVITSAFFQNANWLWLTGFVGFNLFQSAFTSFCPATMAFKAMGLKN